MTVTVTNVSKRTHVLHNGDVLEPNDSKEYAAPLPYHRAVAGFIEAGELKVEGGDLLASPVVPDTSNVTLPKSVTFPPMTQPAPSPVSLAELPEQSATDAQNELPSLPDLPGLPQTE